MANILVVHSTWNYRFRATTRDHLYCFRKYSGHRCYYLNLARFWEPYYRRIPLFMRWIKFDLVIFHADLIGFQWPPYSLEYFSKQVGELRDIQAIKVALIQDEYYHTDRLDQFVNEYGINYVFSLAAESEWPKIYPTVDFQKVKFFRTLPGYLDERTIAQIGEFARSISDRPIDIGYRASGMRQWLGRHGFLKIRIADLFKEKAGEYELTTDISTQPEDTFLGDDWYKFLLRCKYTCSVEGGASVLDRDGSIRTKTESYLAKHPKASFEEIEEACFPGEDGRINYMAISPKHLEACATRTCQVLIEGEYNGVLIPGVHYIELKRDLSNIEQVMRDIQNDHLRAQFTERAYRDIVESGLYSYRQYVDFILANTLPQSAESRPFFYEVWNRIIYGYSRVFEILQRFQIDTLVHLISIKHQLGRVIRALTNPTSLIYHAQKWLSKLVTDPFWSLVTILYGTGTIPQVTTIHKGQATSIDEYWSQHTVFAPRFRSAYQSKRNLEWRFKVSPLFSELSGLYGSHEGEIILDYGCGPGNDLVGFAIYSGARKVIGIDVSTKSLTLAAHRLSLHKVAVERIELIQVSDAMPEIPLPDSCVDFVNCQGVLMHTSYPDRILAEFFRVLRPGGSACIMVYNRESIWFHLFTAYEKMILTSTLSGMNVERAFAKNTDGENCPMARCYVPERFVTMCKEAGFRCEYKGGYLTNTEMQSVKSHLISALDDDRLADIHKAFLHQLTFDDRGMPKYQGYYAGVSGIYQLNKK